MKIAGGWTLSEDGLSWVGPAGRKIPALTKLASGDQVVCMPLEVGAGDATNLLRRINAGLSLWAVDENLQQAIHGFAYDPVCPRVLTRAAGEAAARAALAGIGEKPCSVLYADVDHFKGFNDLAGHACGDEVLRMISDVFRSRIRSTDPLWRIGDEFCAVLPNADLPSARRTAEDIAQAVSKLRVAERSLSVTIGVSAHRASGLRETLNRADSQMLRGKEIIRGKIYEGS